MKSFQLIVTYHAKPGCREAFLREVSDAGIRASVLAEAGCLKYDYYTAVDDPNDFILLEAWENEAAQQWHVKQPHMALLRSIKEKYVVSAELQTFSQE